jgi:HD-GYP domain-containing protein (c-di-GMP phosphodiesterase class II)
LVPRYRPQDPALRAVTPWVLHGLQGAALIDQSASVTTIEPAVWDAAGRVVWGRSALPFWGTWGFLGAGWGWLAVSKNGLVEGEATTSSLAELVSTLSIASDLGMGRPVERVLRQTVIAMRLAEVAGLDAGVRAATYYTSLLTWVGCATDTSDLILLFGEEDGIYADTHDGDLTPMAMGMFVARHLGRGRPALRRVGMVGRFLASAGRSVQKVMEAHCLATGEFSDRLGLGEEVRCGLLQAFERWDGKGVPGKAGATQLSPAIRLVNLADNIEAFHHAAGTGAAVEVARARRGTQFDPDLVDCFCDHFGEVLDGLGELSAWDEVIALDPALGAPMDVELFDEALATMGDFADLKDPARTGHSRRVASLAGAAASFLGLSPAEVTNVRRAGWLHDVGVIGVSSTVWTQPGPWSFSQRERANTHPYLTERMLARAPELRRIGKCAALHHERLDGSGYPKGLTADAIPFNARILAAADVYGGLRQARPHRPEIDGSTAERLLRDEVAADRLDGDAVNAVLKAAGHRVRRRAGLPGGLTAREAEVVVQLARGRSNPEIAEALGVSRRTVTSHLEHVYTKLGVSGRTEAALFAMRNGLIGEPATD